MKPRGLKYWPFSIARIFEGGAGLRLAGFCIHQVELELQPEWCFGGWGCRWAVEPARLNWGEGCCIHRVCKLIPVARGCRARLTRCSQMCGERWHSIRSSTGFLRFAVDSNPLAPDSWVCQETTSSAFVHIIGHWGLGEFEYPVNYHSKQFNDPAPSCWCLAPTNHKP